MRYCVNDNAQANGDHEVHHYDCAWLPKVENRTLLGDFASCGLAVAAAKRIYARSNGCAHCSPACNTG